MSRKYKSILVLLFVFVGSSLLNAASFNCKKAGTFIEHTICGDAKLSKLDEQLARAYKKARKYGNANAIKAEQRQWIKRERKACTNVKCLRSVYASRIDALNGGNNHGDATWAGEYSHVKYNGTLTINRNLSFSYVSVTGRGNICDISGRFIQKRGTLVYKSNVERDYVDCNLKVTSVNNSSLKVLDFCNSGCGLGAGIDEGIYRK